jgi:hypothetical protein
MFESKSAMLSSSQLYVLHACGQNGYGLSSQRLPGGFGHRRHGGGVLRVPGCYRQGQGLAVFPTQQHFAWQERRGVDEGEPASCGCPHRLGSGIEQESAA